KLEAEAPTHKKSSHLDRTTKVRLQSLRFRLHPRHKNRKPAPRLWTGRLPNDSADTPTPG
ncbi:MAG: hypothetical protein NZ585_14865, partial [Chloracidobacterium sp.]|nr:hypothetical protein [Chloracidobacterium sp.]